MEHSVEIILSAIAGTAISTLLARWAITKSLRDLEAALTMCHRINIKLAEIDAKMTHFERTERIVTDHDRKIIEMEVRLRAIGANA